eukprot:5780032-Amphidinium_carterae.1
MVEKTRKPPLIQDDSFPAKMHSDAFPAMFLHSVCLQKYLSLVSSQFTTHPHVAGRTVLEQMHLHNRLVWDAMELWPIPSEVLQM